MKLYLLAERMKVYLTRSDCDKVLQHAMEYDKAHYTKRFNRTIMSTIQNSYQIKIQTDTGANCSVTSDKTRLHQYQRIKAYSIGGVKAEDEAIKAVGKGYIKWTSRDNQTLWIPCYYAPEADGTIISPTDIALTHKKQYSGYTYECDIDPVSLYTSPSPRD